MKLVALSPCEINTYLAAVISTDCNRKLDTFFPKIFVLFHWPSCLLIASSGLRVVMACNLVDR